MLLFFFVVYNISSFPDFPPSSSHFYGGIGCWVFDFLFFFFFSYPNFLLFEIWHLGRHHTLTGYICPRSSSTALHHLHQEGCTPTTSLVGVLINALLPSTLCGIMITTGYYSRVSCQRGQSCACSSGVFTKWKMPPFMGSLGNKNNDTYYLFSFSIFSSSFLVNK
jgi:hypothetical protein